MAIDLTALRAHFPSLDTGLAFFDGPGGTQTPRPVADAVAATLTGPLSNRGTVSPSEANAERAVAEFRSAYADLLHVPAEGVVHGRSATQLTYDFSRHLAKSWHAGDEIVLSRLDHDANVRPWIQAAERAGVTVRWIGIDPRTTELDLDSYERALTPRTRLVAVTAASNVLGTKPPVRHIADRAHDVGALLYVDGVHYAAHHLVDVPALGADLFVCSPYKFLGPHCAVLAAAPELLETLRPDKLLPSPDTVPERFEFGTLPYEILAGATAAVDFLAALDPGTGSSRRERLTHSLDSLHAHELTLRARMLAGLEDLGDAVTLHSKAPDRTATLLMTLEGRDAREAQAHLAARGVVAPAGSFYAYEPFTALGLDAPALRAGLAPYNTTDDVDRFLSGLAAFL
ncbi:cysteine desulfurase-like protein [Streptomyces caniscabiei]|uniref:Cysteine desulfurase-like protein n=1 Tax=Streptomyces caniscabiei TaxID=2746961 RepID=A0A927L9A0_9ACTN|nr:cysteine desulfurase-like protein [Streptomyces caniscabiei]MBD9726414.1 cysteine desulfurase-like protein [Streptomyces caniscabiei]MDX3511729.1 cysteine desulfurase-like protein [Streptomyces caniscabiei]MDX3719278.1 cysteine desulfurase-like protein [Streptomyces caniscabiei]WEO29581.1 cysteine desulfurase-like protein [Streptomyces caniscabiei]